MSLVLLFHPGSIARTITLEMEKHCHKEGVTIEKLETMYSVSNCLRKNVGSSNEAAQVLVSVEDSFERSKWEKFKIGIKMLITDFLIPLGVMISDI